MFKGGLLQRKLASMLAEFGPLTPENMRLDVQFLFALRRAASLEGGSPADSKTFGATNVASDGSGRTFLVVGPLSDQWQLSAADTPAVSAASDEASSGAMVLLFMRGTRTASGYQPGYLLTYYDPDPNGSMVKDAFSQSILQKPLEQDVAREGDLPAMPTGWVEMVMTPWVEGIVVQPGHVLGLATADAEVAAGEQLTISAETIGGDQSLEFDGSAETDGRFYIVGGAGSDILIGGAGDDVLAGMGGADLLIGGGGADTYLYGQAGESTSTGHDRLFDFDPAADKIDLPFAVSGFAAAVTVGSLSTATFDDDLVAALGGLGAGQAIVFRPNDGELLGEVFLIVDANGEEGYQPGEDYVFALPNTDLADLTGNPDIFI